jgi:hypothetical protein
MADKEPDFYYEVDTLAVCRYFDIREDPASGKYIVEMIPEMLQGQKQEPLPPGQNVRMGLDGIVSERDPENWMAGWACRPWFKSHDSAWYAAQEWMKRERDDLYQQCISEVRMGRAYRAAQKAKAHA